MLWSALGVLITSCAIICQIVQLVVSIRGRNALRDVTGDPWDGRSLEWSTPSPPRSFNFAVLPHVEGTEAYWNAKRRAREEAQPRAVPDYAAIEMPRNSATGVVCAFFATLMGFSLIWHIWWIVFIGFLGAYATFVAFAWRDIPEYAIAAGEVARIDKANRETRADALAGSQSASA